MQKKLLLFVITTGLLVFSSCKSSTKEVDWKNIKMGTMGLSIDVPFEFKEKDISSQLTPSVRKMVEKIEMYVNEHNNEYYAVNNVEYTPEVNFSPTNAVNGALQEMAMKSGGKTSDRKDENIKIDGNDAILTKVTITDPKKNEMELQMTIIKKNNRMYQVMGLYKKSDAEAEKNTSRMLESIKII